MTLYFIGMTLYNFSRKFHLNEFVLTVWQLSMYMYEACHVLHSI